MQTTYKLGRQCSSCSVRIYDLSSTGLCKPCLLRQRNREPKARQTSREVGKRNQRYMMTPEVQERRIASIRAFRDRNIRWLPEKYRSEYRRLVKSGVGSKVARVQIERKIRTNSTFEEKLKLVSEGRLGIYTMPARQGWRSV